MRLRKKHSKFNINILFIALAIIIMLLAIIFIVSHEVKHKDKEGIIVAVSSETVDLKENPEVMLVDITTDEEEALWEEIDKMPETIANDREVESGNQNSTAYLIKVNVQANTVTIYHKDGNEEYQPIKAMICSTGSATPQSGQSTIGAKYNWLPLFGNVYGHYCTRIGKSHILFHSVPYIENYNSGSLEYWEFDKLGTSASMGCIRLQIKDTKWIYDNIPAGTVVEFYRDSNPGPLGRPSAPKISDNIDCRDWDPTDPDSNNPWNNRNNDNDNNNNEVIDDNPTPQNDIVNDITNDVPTGLNEEIGNNEIGQNEEVIDQPGEGNEEGGGNEEDPPIINVPRPDPELDTNQNEEQGST